MRETNNLKNKKEVIMVTRTGMINYDQPFYVDVEMKKGGLATAVLFQEKENTNVHLDGTPLTYRV